MQPEMRQTIQAKS